MKRAFLISALCCVVVLLAVVSWNAMYADRGRNENGGGEAENTDAQKIRSIAFEDLQFDEPILRERLAVIEANAKAIADTQWRHEPWHLRGSTGQTPETHHLFATKWCKPATDKSYCSCTREQSPCHVIDLVAIPRDSAIGKPKRIKRWTLITSRYPHSTRWGLRMSYSENWHQGVQVQEHFRISLHDMEQSAGSRSPFGFTLPSNTLELSHKFGVFEYVFFATLENPTNPEFEARKYLSSADSLRRTVLDAQDALESQLEKQIRAGKPTRVLDHDLLFSKPPTRNPPEWGAPEPTQFQSPIPEKYALTGEQKDVLLTQMKADLDQRRALIDANADEMHAAMEATFPLGRLLAEFDKTTAKSKQVE